MDYEQLKALEVKELSYEDYDNFFKEHPNFPNDWGFDEAWIFAKYFFKLGMTISNKVQKEESMEEVDEYFSGELDPKIQYASIESGIKAHAEDYSFNVESELFNQLTKEQQALWRKEIEQACISGGYGGVELARDPRYKENLEVKEVDLEKEINSYFKGFGKFPSVGIDDCIDIAKHFFELGLKAWKGTRNYLL